MKDVQGEHISTAVSYLKGVLMVLQNYGGLMTNLMGLLSDIVCSAEY